MADYKSVIRSPCFDFLVGKDHARVTIHAGIVRHVSEPLDALINNGQMRESNERFAILEDVEEDTFIGFCEYAYTGIYSTPDLKVANVQEETPRPKKRRKFYSAPRWDYSYDRLWYDFSDLTFDGPPASRSNNPDLLFHAKLYVFATKYLVGALQTQCLKSLHRDLGNFYKKVSPQILDLLDFTYANTGRAEPGGGALRNLVIHFVALQASALVQDDKFALILDSNGEMGSDLTMKVAELKKLPYQI